MHITFVDRSSARSIWSLLVPIAKAALARGNTVSCVIWHDGSDDRASPFFEDIPDADIHIINVGPKKRPWDLISQHTRFRKGFRTFLERNKPDIIHVNFAVPGAITTLLARKYSPQSRIITAKHELFDSMAPHWQWVTRYANQRVDSIITVSETVAQSYGLETDRPDVSQDFEIILNGIDTEKLAKIRQNNVGQARSKTCVIAGRMVSLKGQAFALEAFAIAASKDPTLRLDLIGDGPDRQSLEDKSKSLGLEDRVSFPGWIKFEEVAARMMSAHAVLVPSTQEGFGLVLAEGMALGAPIIASDIPVFREVASLGQGVRLCDRNDEKVWASALLSDPEPTRLTGDLSYETMAETYLSVYNKI